MNPGHEPEFLEFFDDNTLQQMFSDADSRMDPTFRALLTAEIERRNMSGLVSHGMMAAIRETFNPNLFHS